MSARIIDGKRIAEEFRREVRAGTDALARSGGSRPGLAVVLVGDDPASAVYVRNKRRARGTGVVPSRTTCRHRRRGRAPRADRSAQRRCRDRRHPRPAAAAGAPRHGRGDRAHRSGQGRRRPAPVERRPPRAGQADRACTPNGLHAPAGARSLEALRHARRRHRPEPSSAGRWRSAPPERGDGHDVSLPTRDLAARSARRHRGRRDRQARDGAARDWIRRGAIVLDVGINRTAGRQARRRRRVRRARRGARAITPVPGGVGPMTIAALMKNTLESAQRRKIQRGRAPIGDSRPSSRTRSTPANREKGTVPF